MNEYISAITKNVTVSPILDCKTKNKLEIKNTIPYHKISS